MGIAYLELYSYANELELRIRTPRIATIRNGYRPNETMPLIAGPRARQLIYFDRLALAAAGARGGSRAWAGSCPCGFTHGDCSLPWSGSG